VNTFTCCSVSPIALSSPSLALATVRAGGVGILDGEFCPERDLEIASQNLTDLLARVGDRGAVGLRLSTDQIPFYYSLLERLCSFPHWIILSRWQPLTLEQAIASLPAASERELLVEVTAIEQVHSLSSLTLNLDGLVVRGQESGGWVGEDPAFILLQKVIQQQPLPVYVQGGIGPHTSAACRAAGASGVVLDDQLWLMPESPLPETWQIHLKALSGQEAILLGERLDSPVRLLSRPGFTAIARLQQLANQCEVAEKDGRSRWQTEAQQGIGWGEPNEKAWPVGLAVGLAAAARTHYQTTGRYIQAILRASEEHLWVGGQLRPLQPGSPLAVSHRTPYPIVQGPMTRVSDSAEFANAVSAAGALPLLALALMRGPQVQALLERTQELLGDRPWGIGILGFVPHSLREEQLQVVRQIKPAFALIAGGRPDQAAQLEAQGIASYIHVPSPKLLQLFLEQGARRFVFEGRECGGHVGPLSSFTLWEGAIDILLREVPVGTESDIHILFAGGIHDALSATMIGALAAPLAERGMRVGVLMGSAYLFTEEAVDCGAIVAGFQKQALACTRTANLETGPGHASRCAVTPFVQEFYDTRRRMLAEGRSAEDIQKTLESLTLGRLRMASKGIVRENSGLIEIPPEQQISDGMYMIGQVATLRQGVITLAQLHEDVSRVSMERLATLALPDTSAVGKLPSKAEDIAIIGISTLLPKAQNPDNFWENILHKVDAISEIPPHRWDWKLYYDANRQARDKIYSKWGGFLEDVPFDPIRFGIPPKSLKSIEPMQLLALEAVRQSLVDAGEAYERGDFDRENTSVILGASGGMGDLGQQYATRAEIPRMVENPDDRLWERLPEWTEESFPGLLMNVTAGRVANRFDLGGSNFTVDAACASSLGAIDLAVQSLESGRCNLAIVGGFDTLQSPFPYFCFSKTQALSPTGKSRGFDNAADGIVISEGVAIVVLKRLADAERDGDRVYATIKAVASSSDGKGLSLTAPASAGQQRAFHRAYQRAGFSPSTVGLYEAHGTGTVAGDRAELASITRFLQEHQTPAKSCVVGSVKTMIGHTKSTAGVAALVKAALSLHYQVLPPHSNVEDPLSALSDEDSPVYLLKEAQPWLRHPDYPRRAAVSAFGFGGTNFHAVLEEYESCTSKSLIGAKAWPWELLVLRAPDRASLKAEVTDLQAILRRGARPRLRDLAYSYAKRARAGETENLCLSLVVEDLNHLSDTLKIVIDYLDGTQTNPLPPHIQMATTKANAVGKIAFLFPGQVAQYPQMAREVALYFPEMRASLELGTRQLRADFPKLLHQFIYPPSGYSEAQKERNQEQLTDTHVAQPTIGIIELGYLEIARKLGLTPDMVAGHSYGEYAALHTAGVFSREDFIRLSEIRGRVMAQACEGSEGAMAVVQATREQLLAYLADEPDVVLANHNAPLQGVISGKMPAVRRLVDRLQSAEIMVKMLTVSGAFHSSLIESAQTALAEAIAEVPMHCPQIPVYSNTTAQPYVPEVAVIRNQLSRHLLSPVEFVEQIKTMYRDGARTFIELGPKSILTRLVSQILEGHDCTVVSIDGQGRGLQGFLLSLGRLAIEGVDFNLTALFQGRDARSLDLSQKKSWPLPTLPASAWLVNGGSARQPNEAIGYTGKLPPLDRAMAEQVKSSGNGRSLPDSSPTSPRGTMPETNPSRQSPQTSITPSLSMPSTVLSPTMLSQSMQPQPTDPFNRTPISGEAALAAYQAYQQTMRQFLSLQEQVMTQFLGGGFSGQISPARSLSYASVPELPRREREVRKNGGTLAPSGSPLMEEPGPKAAERRVAPLPTLPENNAPEVPVAPRPVEGPSVQPARNSLHLDRASLTQTLLSLVSDRTGYPPEMLGLDQDMEADLGIDSIKRVEIFGALQKAVPETLANTLKAQMERFTQVKTLNGVVEALLQSSPTTTGSNPQESNRLGKSHEAVAAPRYVMQGRIQPLLKLDKQRTSPQLTGLFLITEDQLGVASPLASALRQLGAETTILSASMLKDRETLAQAIEQLRQEAGPVQGLIHLTNLGINPWPDNLSDWRELGQIQSKSLFHLLQLCAADLQQTQGYVLSASLFGGHFGRKDGCGPGLPFGGSSAGLLKTMMIEWPEVQAKVIDFEKTPGVDIAQRLLEEIAIADRESEIGYSQGQRIVFSPKLLAASASELSFPVQPASDWVVLSIGGARGITAEIVSELLVPGMTLILVGRSPEPQPEVSLTVGIEDLASLRRVFLQQAREQGQSPTPMQIENKVKMLQRERSILDNLEKFREAGVNVIYYSLDVRDESALGSLIEGIYDRYGRLDAVIQGAGIIQDKLIIHKTVPSFEEVFDTKVDSTFILSRYLRPESLKLVVLFTSVAGRTGNRGQCDYASANEVVNRFAWWMNQQWPQAKVMALNWGPWDVTGMASEEVNRQFRERGVVPIPPESGRRFFTEELRYGSREDVELIAGIFEGVPEEVMAQTSPQTPPKSSSLPLLCSQPQIQPDSSVLLQETISLGSDPYLIDHRLDGTPVLPAAGALEYMAELVQTAWPEWVVAEARNLRVFNGIKLDTEAGRTVRLKAISATHADASSLEVKVEILPDDSARPFYQATLILRPQLEDSPEIFLPPLNATAGLDVTAAYRSSCFHGKLFQLLTAIDGFNEQGVESKVKPSDPSVWLNKSCHQGWIFDPGLVDASLQMALMYVNLIGDTAALPARFGRVVRYGEGPLDPNLRINLRVKEFTPSTFIFDATITDSNNRVRFWLEDMVTTCNPALKRLVSQS
jgi:acyl transferase domain-containing protein/NAD(P)H-dependent flavin oxidoreductase YrpB (nitropropane dioxygenase family)/NAD(P)-dependent dehydrogenase (short-subunit alcohol dehydrogenase family)